MVPDAAAVRRYERHLEATAAWLVDSIQTADSGSSAYFSLLSGWSRPYPETTGYLIPTLLRLSNELHGFDGERYAAQLGSWLLSIQSADGWWYGGSHPPRSKARPSVFNTAQILQGLVALHDSTGEERWLDAAGLASEWLAAGVDNTGLWPHRDYRAKVTPSYYTYAAWPMLEVAVRRKDDAVRDAAEGVLQAILARRQPNGTFSDWGFKEGSAAFTHTIGYTLQGLLSAAVLLDDWDTYGAPVEESLQALAQRAETAQGKLAGRLETDWMPAANYICLTGNAQIALCLLDLDEREANPPLVATAVHLVDAVCDAQRLRAPVRGLRGAVGGSAPIWGRYMMLRYPNWAAKYHCDALVRLIARFGDETT